MHALCIRSTQAVRRLRPSCRDLGDLVSRCPLVVNHLHLAGRFLTYAFRPVDAYYKCGVVRIRVQDLSTGATTDTVPGSPAPGDEDVHDCGFGGLQVMDLVVDEAGRTAYIARSFFTGYRYFYEVFAGGQRVDFGRTIDRRSLELAQDGISWRKNGERRTAPLRAGPDGVLPRRVRPSP